MPASTIVNQETVALGVTFDGRNVSIQRVTFNQEVRGIGSVGYTVDVLGNRDHPPQSHGFVSYEEAKQFVTSFQTATYTTYNQYGDEGTRELVGLGVPPGMLNETQDTTADKPEPNSSQSSFSYQV